jgi:hypothetical protein
MSISPRASEPRTEAELLSREESAARAALSRQLGEIGEGLKEALSVPAWTRERPWVMVAAVSGLGFLSGWGLTRAYKRAQEASAECPEPRVEPEPEAKSSKQASGFAWLASLGNIYKFLRSVAPALIESGRAPRYSTDSNESG